MSANEQHVEENGRDESGRFVAGNTSGVGNPFGRKMAVNRGAAVRAVSEEDLAEIVAAMVQAAKRGNVSAAKVVLAYAVGKPTEAVNPDAVDVEEWKLRMQNPTTDELVASSHRCPPPMYIGFGRGMDVAAMGGVHQAIDAFDRKMKRRERRRAEKAARRGQVDPQGSQGSPWGVAGVERGEDGWQQTATDGNDFTVTQRVFSEEAEKFEMEIDKIFNDVT